MQDITMIQAAGYFTKYQNDDGKTLARLNYLSNGNATVYLGAECTHDIPAGLAETMLVDYMTALVIKALLA